MGQKNNNILLWLSACCDFFINLATVFVTLLLFKDKLTNDITRTSVIIVMGFVLFASLTYLFFNVYSLKRFEKLRRAILRTTLAHLVVYLVVLASILIFTEGKIVYYIFATVSLGVSGFIICVKRILSIKLIHLFRSRRSNDREIIIVGNGDGGIEYAEQLYANVHFGYNIIGCVCDDEEPNFDKLGNLDQLDEVIKEHNPYEIVIALDNNDSQLIQKLIGICDNNGVRVLIVPMTYKFFKSKCQVDMIGDLPVINTRAIPLDNIFNASMKRLMDIVISLIAIILTSPIMIIAALGVKISSKGPVIFKQERVGKNNKTFTMYKFRSMKVNEMSDTAWTTDYDPRKTRFGTFMRKTGIDELPQFFNVLFGSMSIIGPRPELPKFVEQYSKTIPLYRVKHQVKPGITGLAQIYGFRGNTSIEKRIEMDIKYIENWSLFNDIKILVLTPFKMFNRNEKYVK